MKPVDLIVILLNYLRCYPRFERGAFTFNLKISTYEKYVKTSFVAVKDFFYQRFVTNPAEHLDLPISETYPDAPYGVDATVQKIYTPIVQFVMAKQFFSGKHYRYCIKSQMICDSFGSALHVASGYVGSMHDMQIFRQNIQSFQDEIVSTHPDAGTKILTDKGYISNEFSSLLTTPVKGLPYDLSPEENEHNQKLASARVVVERFFGKLKIKFYIMKNDFRGDRDEYSNYFKLCIALTKIEIRQCGNPLSQDDSNFYERWIANLIYIEKQNYEDECTKCRENRLARVVKKKKKNHSKMKL